jgi:hypothetical protein
VDDRLGLVQLLAPWLRSSSSSVYRSTRRGARGTKGGTTPRI